MASSLNRATIIGRLGGKPPLRHTNSGTAVTNFSVATNEYWRDRDGEARERTTWHQVSAWARLAEICNEYLEKGSRVYIEGPIRNRQYETNEGVTRYVTEIVATDMTMLGGPNGNGSNGSNGEVQNNSEESDEASQESTETPSDGDVDESDLPF